MTGSVPGLLADIYDAWRANDLDRLATYLPDDFAHFINIPSELHPLGEVRQGKGAVIERLGLLFQEFETQQFEIGPIAIGPDSASVELRTRCRHRPSGAMLEMTKSNLWTLEGGWPVKLFEHYDLDRFQAFLQSARGKSSAGT